MGGALLESFWWGSLFLALAPIALIAALGAVVFIPASRPNSSARLDRGGLLLSVVMLGSLVYTIIEAPEHGWTAPRTLAGFAIAVAAAVAFVAWERRQSDPLIDVSLFTNLRFSAASAAVTVAFFALFGFIFLITQFFQLLQNYGPLETGIRILPVALSIALGSVVGTQLSVTRIGTKAVVFVGLLMLTAAFAWVATVSVDVSYLEVALQMVVLGGGLGLTTAPATDSIMGVVRPEQAGAGSAVNDATRQIGGTLGVAIIGIATGFGGGILRDLLLAEVPSALGSNWYLIVATAAALFGMLLERLIARMGPLVNVLDALTIGLFGALGTTKALSAGLPEVPSIFVGVVSAVGGSILRDLLLTLPIALMHVGSLYAIAAGAGAIALVIMLSLGVPVLLAATICVALTAGVRILAVVFEWSLPEQRAIERLPRIRRAPRD
jgi:uncharacterized membrane protein YeiH